MSDISESSGLLGNKLPFLQRLSYGIGHVQNDLSASMWFSYLIIYFHLVRNFDNRLAGYLMLIGQVSDALFTPFIGLESDRTKGIAKLGKRKTWHFIGTICVTCSFPFVFNKCFASPHAPDWAQFIYYAPFVVIFQFGWASTQISHLSLIPDLTPDENERKCIHIFGIAWLLFDLHSSSDKSQDKTAELSSKDSSRFQELVFIVTGIGLLFSFLFHFGVREKKQRSLNWIKEKQFYQDAVAIMPLVVYVSGLVTSLLMKTVNKRIGRKGTYFIGQIVSVGCCVWVYFLNPDTYKQVYGVCICLGIGGTTMLVTSLAMTADLIGRNVESGAFVYGAMSFTDKLSNGVAVVLIQEMHPCTARLTLAFCSL
ncbi:hypothetical protein KUTeg_018426, partial [Tegillarca granosa]